MASGSPPGLGASFVECPSRDAGTAHDCYNRMANGLARINEIQGAVAGYAMNVDKYVMELSKTTRGILMAVGSMFQQESMRTTAPIREGAGAHKKESCKERGVMEYKVIMNLTPVNGDKSWFRQWHLKFVTAIGQVRSECEELVQKLIKEIDLGRDLGVALENTSLGQPETHAEAAKDPWKVPIDKAEAEACEKIKSLPQGEGLRAYGVLRRWFTDASGLGLAEQVRRLTHSEAPKKEEDLAEYVDVCLDKLRRLESHGDDYKLAPVIKASA